MKQIAPPLILLVNLLFISEAKTEKADLESNKSPKYVAKYGSNCLNSHLQLYEGKMRNPFMCKKKYETKNYSSSENKTNYHVWVSQHTLNRMDTIIESWKPVLINERSNGKPLYESEIKSLLLGHGNESCERRNFPVCHKALRKKGQGQLKYKHWRQISPKKLQNMKTNQSHDGSIDYVNPINKSSIDQVVPIPIDFMPTNGVIHKEKMVPSAKHDIAYSRQIQIQTKFPNLIKNSAESATYPLNPFPPSPLSLLSFSNLPLTAIYLLILLYPILLSAPPMIFLLIKIFTFLKTFLPIAFL